MLASLVSKYGVCPKDVYPETLTSGASRLMNKLLTHKLRQFSMQLRRANAGGASVEDLRANIAMGRRVINYNNL